MDELLQFLGRSLFFGESKENIDVGSTGNRRLFQWGVNKMSILIRTGDDDVWAYYDGTLLDTGHIPTEGVYHFYVSVFDGANLKVFVDGVEIGSQADIGAADSNTFMIGATTAGGQQWKGAIKSTSIYNRALNASQIKDLYRDPWLPFKQDRIIFAPTAVTGAVRLIDGGLIGSGLIGDRLIA